MNHLKTTYTSGAARAAQIAKIPNASGKLGTNTVRSVLSNPYRLLERDNPDPKPNWVTDVLDAIKSFGRKICDANAKQLETQLELEQAEMQGLRAIGKTFGQTYEKYSEFIYTNEQLNNEMDRVYAETNFHLLFSSIVLGVADFLPGEIVFRKVSDANYAVNSKLDAENRLNGIVGEGIYINGQATEPFLEYQFGNGSTLAKHGCMAFSIYDANIRLDDFEELADIQYGIETNGYVGMFGTGSVATYIPKYFGEKGYDVHLNLAPTPEELEWMAQEYDTVIITRYNSTNLLDGSHYMNLYYDDNANEYVINNWGSWSSSLKTVQGLDEIYGVSINRPYFAFGISRKDK